MSNGSLITMLDTCLLLLHLTKEISYAPLLRLREKKKNNKKQNKKAVENGSACIIGTAHFIKHLEPVNFQRTY